MSKAVKITIIVAVSVLALGIGVCVLGFFLSGGTGGSKYETRRESFSSDITLISTDLSVADIKIAPSGDSNISFFCYENDKQQFSADEVNGTLSIEQTRQRKWYENFLMWFDFKDFEYDIEIGLPEDYAGSLKIETKTGDIVISGCTNSDSVKATSVTGDIRLSSVSCTGDIDISLRTGSVSLDSVRGKGIYYDGVSGDFECGNVECTSLSASVTTGEIDLGRLTCNDVKLTVTTGDIEADLLSVGKSAYVSSTTGDVEMHISGEMNDYAIKSHTTTGDNNLPENSGSGEKTLEVYSTTGEIEVTFAG